VRSGRGVDAVLSVGTDGDAKRLAAADALDDRRTLRDFSNDASGANGTADRIPVVVCMWKRQYRLDSILRMLARQSVRCDVYLWNNDPTQQDAIERTVADAENAPDRVFLATSPANVGGFGRFFWAAQIAADYPYVVFVDDDEIVDDHSISTFASEFAPGTIRSAWAFRFTQRHNYWRRRPVGIGEPAKYCGTGGMVCDTAIFRDERLFRCRDEYWFCEDIWLSYLASTAFGWRLSKSAAEVGWLLDDAAQFPGLHRRKSQFFRFLNRTGGWIDPT
jgi:hypothetical protein